MQIHLYILQRNAIHFLHQTSSLQTSQLHQALRKQSNDNYVFECYKDEKAYEDHLASSQFTYYHTNLKYPDPQQLR